MKHRKIITDLLFLSALIFLGISTDANGYTGMPRITQAPAVIAIKKFIDAHIEKFDYKEEQPGDDDKISVNTYSYDGLAISQHIRRNVCENLIYKINGLVLEIDVGRHLFYYIQQKLEERAAEKAVKLQAGSVAESYKIIENVVKELME